MKKTIKILAIMLIAMSLLFVTVQPTLAAYGEGVEDIIDNATNSDGAEDVPSDATKITTTIINWIWWASIIIAIIVLMIIGIRYMIGGTQEKAEYKKSLIPVLVGVIIIVFATTIVRVLFSMNSSSSTTTTNQTQGSDTGYAVVAYVDNLPNE